MGHAVGSTLELVTANADAACDVEIIIRDEPTPDDGEVYLIQAEAADDGVPAEFTTFHLTACARSIRIWRASHLMS